MDIVDSPVEVGVQRKLERRQNAGSKHNSEEADELTQLSKPGAHLLLSFQLRVTSTAFMYARTSFRDAVKTVHVKLNLKPKW